MRVEVAAGFGTAAGLATATGPVTGIAAGTVAGVGVAVSAAPGLDGNGLAAAANEVFGGRGTGVERPRKKAPGWVGSGRNPKELRCKKTSCRYASRRGSVLQCTHPCSPPDKRGTTLLRTNTNLVTPYKALPNPTQPNPSGPSLSTLNVHHDRCTGVAAVTAVRHSLQGQIGVGM
jgi:hypothetical protein